MPIHNDEVLFTLQAFVSGTKLNGTGTDGRRAQFSFDALMTAFKLLQDAVHFQNATRVGQTVIGNQPNAADTSVPAINNGDPFFGTLNTFPATEDSHIDFITKITRRS